MAGPVLSALGFGPFFEAQVSEDERAALLPGRAVADRGRRLAVRFEDAERLVVVPGRLKAAGEVPVVGDFVLAHPADEPRRSCSASCGGRESVWPRSGTAR